MFNLIVKDSKWEDKDKQAIFGNEDIDFIHDKTLEDLAVRLKVYKSKSQCRQAGRSGLIPSGYNEIWLSKKVQVFIWNPPEYTSFYE